ncbi:MAG TPA: polysaccharide ABC transporter ATP-binding protein [Mucilaginibacter sp.]|nr:polysaccharide ABC transporter ATP-binding protein [Mucilaginibacter sp.]
MPIAIKAENVSKAYQLGDFGTGTISRDLERFWAKAHGKEDPFTKIGELNDRTLKGNSDIVWSLHDLNFEIDQGDTVGIIGRNGAGKSTLLKILSRVTSPTTGSIKVKGRIASLLEVGTGFHPELTGKENIFLNGAILGMRKVEIKRKFDEIVDFAGVERYIDTPVKRYSSGMYVRLAFAVAAHLDSEILIVDEVLSVGDAEFQKKCLGKMEDVSKGEGRTVLFVSHNMDSVSRLCKKGILLNNGAMSFTGDINQTIGEYKKSAFVKAANLFESPNKDSLLPYIKNATLSYDHSIPDSGLRIQFSITMQNNAKPAFVAFDIKNSMGTTVMQAIPQADPFIDFQQKAGEYVAEVAVHGLIPDTYSVSIWIGPHNTVTYDWSKDILQFEIIESPVKGRTYPHSPLSGFFIPMSTIRKIN